MYSLNWSFRVPQYIKFLSGKGFRGKPKFEDHCTYSISKNKAPVINFLTMFKCLNFFTRFVLFIINKPMQQTVQYIYWIRCAKYTLQFISLLFVLFFALNAYAKKACTMYVPILRAPIHTHTHTHYICCVMTVPILFIFRHLSAGNIVYFTLLYWHV